MDNKRPVNLDLGTIKLPITSYVSILHRISGVALFGVIAVFLWLLDGSLSSKDGFHAVKDIMNSPICKLILSGSLAALLYHLVAGIRHLIMDLGIGESLEGGRLGAKLVAIVSIVLIILIAGVWVWV